MSRYLAIDLDSSGLCVASGTLRGSAVAIERTLVWSDARLPLTALSAAELGERFKEALKTAGITAAPVLVGVGRERVILKDLRYPPVPPAEEPNIVRFQAMKDLSESPDEIVLDYVPQRDTGGERRATAFVLKKDHFLAIQGFIAAAGLKLAGVTPRPFAVSAALRRAMAGGVVPALPQADDVAGVMYVSPQGGEFTVFRGDQILFTRTIPASAAATAESLVAEMKRNLAVYGGPNALQPLAALYVAEAESPGHAGRLRQALSVPVHAFDPLADAPTAVPADAAGRFAGAIGLLALRTVPEMPINFVSPRQPRAEADPNRKALLLTVLACTLVLGIGAVFGFLALTRAESRLASAMTQKKNAEELLVQTDADAKRMQAVEDWSKREVVWLDELYDLFDRFPDMERARVTTLTGQSLPTDKAGKQPAQAKLEVKVAAASPEPVNAFLSAFDRDNHERNKFYVNPVKTSNGIVSGTNAGAMNLLYTISMLVNRRPAVEFTRQSLVSPPPAASRTAAVKPVEPPTVEAVSTTPTAKAATPAASPAPAGKAGFRPPNFNDDWFK